MSAAALLLALLQGAGTGASVTARVTPEAPGVGEPITLEVRVRAPAGSGVRFPVMPDTGTRLEPLDPRALRDGSTGSAVDRTAVYRFIAWDTGTVTLPLGDVTVERAGATQRYPVALAPIRIRSVLPGDSASRQPRPSRPPVDAASLRWRWWVALAVLAALAYASWRQWRRWRAVRAATPNGVGTGAQTAFAHVRALDLLSVGEPGRHALAHAGVMRRYLAGRWPELPESLTATELAARLATVEFPILPERVIDVARRAEDIAYARAAVTPEEAERLGMASEAVVRDVETVWTAREAERTSARIRRKRLRQ